MARMMKAAVFVAPGRNALDEAACDPFAAQRDGVLTVAIKP